MRPSIVPNALQEPFSLKEFTARIPDEARQRVISHSNQMA